MNFMEVWPFEITLNLNRKKSHQIFSESLGHKDIKKYRYYQ